MLGLRLRDGTQGPTELAHLDEPLLNRTIVPVQNASVVVQGCDGLIAREKPFQHSALLAMRVENGSANESWMDRLSWEVWRPVEFVAGASAPLHVGPGPNVEVVGQ